MQVEVFFDPVFHIVITDLFDNETNRKILDETLLLKHKFEEAEIGTVENQNKVNKDIRNNLVAYYDVLFQNNREESILLRSLNKLFIDGVFSTLINTSQYPLSDFRLTNYHETQVSRYGNTGDKYDWHNDQIHSNESRKITMVYYFNTEPKKYSGGELQLTNSPIFENNILDKNTSIKTIEPKNNMLVIFASNITHRVMPLKSTNDFKDGRFSVNCWVGKR